MYSSSSTGLGFKTDLQFSTRKGYNWLSEYFSNGMQVVGLPSRGIQVLDDSCASSSNSALAHSRTVECLCASNMPATVPYINFSTPG